MHQFAIPFLFAAAMTVAGITSAQGQDIGQLPVTVTFVVSGGLWEEPGDVPEGASAAPGGATPVEGRRGYYKLVSIRQPDRTAKVYLQQIAATQAGPQLVQSVELEEFTAIRPYVTNIRTEDSSGMSTQPGFFATVYLKTAPTDAEAESWTVLIDDLGDIRVERATN